jgi:arsenate reductase (thioredoxin)
MKQGSPYRVLFLCTGNSARSIFAEYFLRRLGGSRFEAFSAGSHPSANGAVHPLALKVLKEKFNIVAREARSKSWDEYQAKGLQFDFVITVCDSARESCPLWPGQPIVAHWGVEDPAAFVGNPDAQERFFAKVALLLHHRIQLFTSLPLEKLDRLRIEELTKGLGRRSEAELPKRAADTPEPGASDGGAPLPGPPSAKPPSTG